MLPRSYPSQVFTCTTCIYLYLYIHVYLYISLHAGNTTSPCIVAQVLVCSYFYGSSSYNPIIQYATKAYCCGLRRTVWQAHVRRIRGVHDGENFVCRFTAPLMALYWSALLLCMSLVLLRSGAPLHYSALLLYSALRRIRRRELYVLRCQSTNRLLSSLMVCWKFGLLNSACQATP